jgi:hypothetical protein
MRPKLDRLATRFEQIRGALVAPDAPPETPAEDPGSSPVQALRTRVAHLEQLVEGLQDSVHREAQRQELRLSDLEARVEPAALAAELSKNARERGL